MPEDSNNNKEISFHINNDKISLPMAINKSNSQYPHVREYNPELLKDILLDIANKPALSVEKVCKEHNTSDAALYTWMLFNSDIERAYFECKRIRETGKVDKLDETYNQIIEDMEGITENDKVKLRKIDLKTRLHRVNSLNVQWSAGKLHKEYRDKQEVEHKIDPVAGRIEAWQSIQARAQEGEYTDEKDHKDEQQDT